MKEDIQELYCITHQGWFLRDYGNCYLDWTGYLHERLLLDKPTADLLVQIIQSGGLTKPVRAIPVAID